MQDRQKLHALPLIRKAPLALGISLSLLSGVSQGAFELEEIIVEAQKREQNLQDVGVSVTALDSKAMDRAGIADVSRLELVTPGVTFGFIGSDAKIAIRGANSDNTFGDNTSIAGTFIDGVYRPRASQQTQAYFDVQRIEVLKGPQGTLYGRNTFAGAVNLYTNAPSTEEFDLGIDLSFQRFSKFTSEAFINVPVNDDFAVRLAINTKDSDGYIENRGAGADMGSDDAHNLRLSALWNASDSVQAIIRYTSITEKGITPGIFSAEGICQPLNSDGITDAFGTFENCSNPDPLSEGETFFTEPWVVAYDVDAERDNAEDNVTLDVTWDVSESMRLRSISSYTDFESAFVFDREWSNAFGNYNYWDEGVESVTQELQLLSTGDGPFTWTGGLYYSVDDINFGFARWVAGEADLAAADFADLLEIETTTYGVFFQGEIAISDTLRLIGGIRYNEEDKDTDDFNGSSQDADGNALPGVALGRELDGAPSDIFRYTQIGTNEQSFEEVTWRLGVEFDMSDNILMYANAATGFLSGGFNTNTTTFEQQESLAIEAGIKSRWADDSIQLNVSLYLNEFKNLVTQQFLPATGQTISVNSGIIDSLGLEAELVWLPTENWYISAALSLLDSELDEFGVSNNFEAANGDETVAFIQLDGETPPSAPDITLSLSIGYDIDLGDNGRLTPFIQFYYSDEYNTDNLVTYAQQVQDSFSKTDARLIWESADEKFSVEVFIENIEDEAVLARSNVGSFDIVQTSYLYPQNYGVRLGYNF